MIEQLLLEQSYKNFNLYSINKSWQDFFQQEIRKGYFLSLLEKLEKKYSSNNCCPEKENIFRLFHEISPAQIKVVILGQDPYHLPGVADGIAFSNKKEGHLPATLKNIFLELSSDLNCPMLDTESSNLLPLVKEGVFLLNTTLSVDSGQPLSHFELWEEFTSSLIDYLMSKKKNIVWVFWGRKAQNIMENHGIDRKYSLVSAHPSPFSAEKYGFFGSKPFSKVNELLIVMGEKPINWLTLVKPKVQ